MSIATNVGGARGSSGTKPIDVSAIAPLAPPTPADKPVVPGTQPVPPRFAELLRQSRVDAPAPPPALPAPSPNTHDESRAAPEPSASAPTASNDAKVPAANAAKARAAAAKSASATSTAESTPRPNEGTPDATDARAHRADRDASTTRSAGGTDPSAATAIAAESARALGRASGGADDGAASATAERGASSDPLRRGTGHSRAAATLDAAADRHDSLADASREQALKVGLDGDVRAALAVSESAETAAPRRQEHAGDTFAASLAAASTARAADAAPAPTANVAVTVPTPLDSPDFATAFGVQVSVLARDGVQHAELHLNPTEMGPVSIHISLDGTAARVDFGADVAATRQAIERGLPELASTLRDAGFTLAGGGVSAHAGSGRSPAGDDAPTSRLTRTDERGDAVSPAAIVAGAARVVRGVAAGGVDLYA